MEYEVTRAKRANFYELHQLTIYVNQQIAALKAEILKQRILFRATCYA